MYFNIFYFFCMWDKKIFYEINLFENEVNYYEQILRTKFTNNPQKNIVYQLVNSETQRMKDRINFLLNFWWNTWEQFRINSLSTRARELIMKYEIVRDKLDIIDSDVLYLYGQLSILLSNKYNWQK